MSHIELHEVSFSYGRRPVLDDVSVIFGRNRVTAILGRSGSGKSTLLHHILGLFPPDRGQVIVDGVPVRYPTSLHDRFRFGYVVQGNGIFPHLTVQENISLPGRMTGVPARATYQRVRLLMKLAGLEGNQTRFPYQLSISEQMRVLLCRAYFFDPPVLLMDEPFSSLEPSLRNKIHNEFKIMQQRYPRTVLLVTHDRREAERLADDILVLDQGRVQQFGKKQQILQRPANVNVRHVLEVAVMD